MIANNWHLATCICVLIEDFQKFLLLWYNTALILLIIGFTNSIVVQSLTVTEHHSMVLCVCWLRRCSSDNVQ